MVKNHLSRLNAPKSWPIKKKGIKFVKRPNPGPHTLRKCMPLSILMSHILKYARTNKEIKKVLHEGNILVNGKIRKDPAYPVGVMDIISAPILKEHYRVLFNEKGKFTAVKINEKESKEIMLQINDKVLIKKGKIQLNFSNGTNLLVPKGTYKTFDTIVISFDDKKVQKHYTFEKGANVYLDGGKRIGTVGKIEEIKEKNVMIKSDKLSFETAKRFCFVIGDVKLQNE